jgi:proline racemase
MRLNNAITVIGCHAEGEVGRVVTGGVLPPPGDTLMAQKLHLERSADGLRKFLLYEPRGGAFVHANLVVPAKTPGAAAGFIIMEPTDYPPMSGSNCICVATVLLETGMIPMQEPETRVTLETPGGLVPIVAQCRDGKCVSVRLENVPCYAAALDVPVEVPGLGTVRMDVGYGGAFFGIVDARALGFSITPDEARDLVVAGEKIKAAAVEQHPVRHRENPDIHTITFTQFIGPVTMDEGVKTARNTVVISPGKLDRSPCGTGTSARLAVMHAKGQIATGERFISRSVIGSRFDASVVRETAVGGEPGIVPSIEGRAWITGIHTYGLDPTDPFPQGYTLSDTWYRALD